MTDGTFTNRKRSERDKREKGKIKKIAFMLLLSTNEASFVPTVEQRKTFLPKKPCCVLRKPNKPII
jgi:hypothetical protein